MYIKQATVNNQVGLHARPATFFIQKANEFKSTIWVEKDDQRVNAKSLLGVLSLGIIKGSTIDLVVSRGPQMVEMPNVAGFTRDGAEQQLAQVGLNASFYPIYNDGSYVSGCVAYCSEEPGAMVEVGSTIIVYMAAEVEAEVPATPPETTTPSAGTTPSAAQTEPPADGAGTEYDTD